MAVTEHRTWLPASPLHTRTENYHSDEIEQASKHLPSFGLCDLHTCWLSEEGNAVFPKIFLLADSFRLRKITVGPHILAYVNIDYPERKR